MTQLYVDSQEELRRHGRSGGFSRGARFAHVVEGKRVTTREIAARLGVAPSTALARTRRGPFPLTWEGLKR